MASKRRVRRDQCTRKVKLDQGEAIRRAVTRRTKTGERWHAYRCPHCGMWHIGHTPWKVRQAIAAKRRAKKD